MFSKNDKSLIQLINEQTLKDFHKSHKAIKMIPNENNDFVDGNVIFRTPINRTSLQNLLTINRFPVIDEALNDRSRIKHHSVIEYPSDTSPDTGNIFANVTEQIINITGPHDFKAAMKIIASYKQALGNNFFGALLRHHTNKDIIINPFHILTTLSILSDDMFLHQYKFDILIYVYSDREAMDIKYNTHFGDKEKCIANINALMNAFSNKIKVISKSTLSETNDSKLEFVKIGYSILKHPDEDPNATHYISATQIVSKGIAAPWYASSLLKMNGDTSGLHLAPLKTCNISSDDDISTTNKPEYQSVCTGSNSKYTIEGLRSLSHANFNSPFGKSYFMDGGLVYVDTMISKCEDIYIAAKILDESEKTTFDQLEPIPEPQEENLFPTKEQLACLSLREFFDHQHTIDAWTNPVEQRKLYQDLLNYKEQQESS